MGAMRKLVYLYPRAWRARYGEEFLALLDEQAPTPRVVVDLILGAVDAHLRPQVSRADRGVPDIAGATTTSPSPAGGGLFANLLIGATLIYIELALRLVALCDEGLRDYLRELSATTSSPGPFLVPKFLCGERSRAGSVHGQARAPIVTTGIRRPIAPVQARLAAEPS